VKPVKNQLTLLWAAGALVLAVPALAQHPSEAQIQQALNNPSIVDQLRQRIQQSGLTPDQIRAKLTAAGYSPTLLDQYLTPGGTDTTTVPGQDVYRALSLLDVGAPPVQGLQTVRVDTGAARAPVAPVNGLQLFGTEVFRGRTSQFQPLLTGPVPPSYRIGPGDVMVLVLTGDVESAQTLEVTREGFIVIPQVGQIYVNGLNMDEMRRTLSARLSKSYSGIRAGTTHFDVTIARLRTIQVFVTGEVMQPGAYQLASVATVLNALYAAGGPSDRGNFRQVQLRRQNGVAANLDLYDYLLKGDTRNDLILEQGDLIFVPVYAAKVTLDGAVVRPAIYELNKDQKLSDLIAAAGGFGPDAELKRITIHRLLPAGQRSAGRPARVAIDVPLGVQQDSVVLPPMSIEDGDSVIVDRVLPLAQSYYVSVTGMVEKPGQYPWHEGMTLKALVHLARGPRIGADLRESEVARLPADRSAGQLATKIRVPLDSSYLFQRDSTGRFAGAAGVPFPAAGSAPDFPLEPFDNVLILQQPQFEFQRTVEIVGEVRYPGNYALVKKDDRLSDLVERAGGLLPTAYPAGAQFIRDFAKAGRVNIDLQRIMANPKSSENIILQPGDSLQIPEYIPTVRVEGGVNNPVSVQYHEGADLGYYIENAGGYSRFADKGRVSVRYANGTAKLKRRHLAVFVSSPIPGPGSLVQVPVKPADKTDFGATIANIAQIVTTAATVLIVALRL